MKLVLLLLPSFHSSQTCFKIKTLLYSVVHVSAFDHLPEPEMLFLLPINWLLSGDKGVDWFCTKISFRYYANQKRTLEVNPRHPLVKELLKRVETDKEDKTAKDLARVLFETATLRSGYMVKVGVISFNPWQPNIIVHILLAVLYRFLQYQQWEFV